MIPSCLLLFGIALGAQLVGPGPVAGHRLAFDPAGHQILLYRSVAPANGGSGPVSELWSLRGSRWQRLSQGGPPGREDAQLVMDSRRNRLVLYGGRQRGPERSFRSLVDTWEWDGRAWSMVDSAGPPPRGHAGMGYDARRGVTILFGGFAPDDSIRTDTWEWNGRAWARRADAGPSRRWVNGVGWDARDGEILLHVAMIDSVDQNTGIAPGELWRRRDDRWDRIGAAPRLSPQQQPVVADFGLVYFYGWQGGAPPVTWLWDRHEWRRIEGPSPTARRSADLVYDPERKVIVLIGGEDDSHAFDDRWEFDGTAWRQVSPVPSQR